MYKITIKNINSLGIRITITILIVKWYFSFHLRFFKKLSKKLAFWRFNHLRMIVAFFLDFRPKRKNLIGYIIFWYISQSKIKFDASSSHFNCGVSVYSQKHNYLTNHSTPYFSNPNSQINWGKKKSFFPLFNTWKIYLLLVLWLWINS